MRRYRCRHAGDPLLLRFMFRGRVIAVHPLLRRLKQHQGGQGAVAVAVPGGDRGPRTGLTQLSSLRAPSLGGQLEGAAAAAKAAEKGSARVREAEGAAAAAKAAEQQRMRGKQEPRLRRQQAQQEGERQGGGSKRGGGGGGGS